jgi:hypothetical protein
LAAAVIQPPNLSGGSQSLMLPLANDSRCDRSGSIAVHRDLTLAAKSNSRFGRLISSVLSQNDWFDRLVSFEREALASWSLRLRTTGQVAAHVQAYNGYCLGRLANGALAINVIYVGE